MKSKNRKETELPTFCHCQTDAAHILHCLGKGHPPPNTCMHLHKMQTSTFVSLFEFEVYMYRPHSRPHLYTYISQPEPTFLSDHHQTQTLAPGS